MDNNTITDIIAQIEAAKAAFTRCNWLHHQKQHQLDGDGTVRDAAGQPVFCGGLDHDASLRVCYTCTGVANDADEATRRADQAIAWLHKVPKEQYWLIGVRDLLGDCAQIEARVRPGGTSLYTTPLAAVAALCRSARAGSGDSRVVVTGQITVDVAFSYDASTVTKLEQVEALVLQSLQGMALHGASTSRVGFLHDSIGIRSGAACQPTVEPGPAQVSVSYSEAFLQQVAKLGLK